jgi:hypothetical protein
MLLPYLVARPAAWLEWLRDRWTRYPLPLYLTLNNVERQGEPLERPLSRLLGGAGAGDAGGLLTRMLDRGAALVLLDALDEVMDEARYRWMEEEIAAFARRHPRAVSPKRWDDGPGDLPATSVSLGEARAYPEAHDMRLPTLAELAHAATSADTDPYPWGGHYDAARANTRESGIGCLRPVGSFQSGASRHGVLDVLGNAAEWTETRIGRHEFAVAGGSYRGPLVSARLRGFRTYRLQPTARLADVGLRLARSLPALGTAAD